MSILLLPVILQGWEASGPIGQLMCHGETQMWRYGFGCGTRYQLFAIRKAGFGFPERKLEEKQTQLEKSSENIRFFSVINCSVGVFI